MRIVFSRKGFDSSAGGSPSPIVDGVPISLPIPTAHRSETTYRLAGLGEIVERATNRRIRADDLCHEDPMFLNGNWAFGQTGASQSHLDKNGVGVGDVFLFFGLFGSNGSSDRHHRIFGYLEVRDVRRLGAQPLPGDSPVEFLRRHPHTIGAWNENNTLYMGTGAMAQSAHPDLRLTKLASLPTVWQVPTWLRLAGLTYHRNPARWLNDQELRIASRGQEFVTDVGKLLEPRQWLAGIKKAIEVQRCAP